MVDTFRIFYFKSCLAKRSHINTYPLDITGYCAVCCSDEKCYPAPKECDDIIPYTTHSNSLYGLNSTEDYMNFSMSVKQSLHNCTIDPFMARWAACNMIFPRCLLGWELQLCRQSCLGMNILDYIFSFIYNHSNLSKKLTFCCVIDKVLERAFCFLFAEEIQANCQGDARNHMEMLCMELPEEECAKSPADYHMNICGEKEFGCGDNKCIHKLDVCDGNFECITGADEIMW